MEIKPATSEQSPSERIGANLFEWPFLEKSGLVFLIGIPTLIFLLLSIPSLGKAYWLDEVFSVTASRSLSGLFHMFRELENNMSLYQILLYFWMRVFGESEVATRSLSLLFGLLTIPLFFRLLRYWFNKSITFYGTLLLAVNPMFVYYATESRSYAMLILSTTISTLLFVRLLLNSRWSTAFWYGFSIAIGVYIHYFAILVTIVHAGTLSRKNFSKKYITAFLIAGAVALVGILPLFLFPPRAKTQVDWILKPDFPTLWYVFSAEFGGGYVIVLLAACLFFVWRGMNWKNAKPDELIPEKLSIVWSIFPILLLFLFSVLVKPVFLRRFFVWCVPGTALFSCLCIILTNWSRQLKSLVLILVIGLITWKTVVFSRLKGSGFEESVAFMKKRIKPGDAVIVYPYFWELDVNYYLDKSGSKEAEARPIPINLLPYAPGGGSKDPDPDLLSVRRLAGKPGRIYLFCNGNPGLSKSDTVLKRLWLPQIQTILSGQHPKEEEMVFGKETDNPVRLKIFE
ncbi:MAG: glycosyltransferase family 39 protein [Chitinophagales bacterium]